MRSPWWWKTRVLARADEWLVFEDPQTARIDGLVGWRVRTSPGAHRLLAEVRECIAATPAAWRGLVGALAAQGEQVGLIDLQFARGGSAKWLREHDRDPVLRLATITTVGGGAMARIGDLETALTGGPRPAQARVRGRVGLDVVDPVGGRRTIDVRFGARGTSIADARPGKRGPARLGVGIDRLSQIVLGAERAADLLDHGLVDGDAEAAALLDAAFAGPSPFFGPANYF